jgi:hypothetical protein
MRQEYCAANLEQYSAFLCQLSKTSFSKLVLQPERLLSNRRAAGKARRNIFSTSPSAKRSNKRNICKDEDWGSESQEEGTLKIQRREATEIAALKLQVSAVTKELSDVRSILSKAIKRIETLERTCKTANNTV